MSTKHKKQTWYQKVADMYGFQVSPEGEKMIIPGLEARKESFGARYCPCKIQKVVENVCPCVELRLDGTCTCGLFYRD